MVLVVPTHFPPPTLSPVHRLQEGGPAFAPVAAIYWRRATPPHPSIRPSIHPPIHPSIPTWREEEGMDGNGGIVTGAMGSEQWQWQWQWRWQWQWCLSICR